MSDIVQRLRDSATQARALDRAALLNEAADEIERLRSTLAGYTGGISSATETKSTLTDAEREAVEAGIEKLDHFWFVNEAATLRGLLERMK